MDDTETAREALADYKEHVGAAIDALHRAMRAAPDALRGVIEQYPEGHLRDWLSNERQCGSLPDLLSRL